MKFNIGFHSTSIQGGCITGKAHAEQWGQSHEEAARSISLGRFIANHRLSPLTTGQSAARTLQGYVNGSWETRDDQKPVRSEKGSPRREVEMEFKGIGIHFRKETGESRE